MTASIIYYSDCRPDPDILATCRTQLAIASGNLPIVAVTLKPIEWSRARCITLDAQRSRLTMFRQILMALEVSEGDFIFFCEHDVLYHHSRFKYVPSLNSYGYNRNQWRVNAETGHCLHYLADQTSGLCGSRELLLAHYRRRIALAEQQRSDSDLRFWGYEPGSGRSQQIDRVPVEHWWSDVPDIDIRHGSNLTLSRWSQDRFRDQSTCLGWTESDRVPGWPGPIEGHFREWLREVVPMETPCLK